MTAYQVKLSGCDDTTVFVTDLDEDQAALVERIAAQSRETSQFDCQPRMTLTAAPDPEEDVPF